MPFDGTQNAVASALRTAKARIDTPEKWCKGAFYFGDMRCAEGAMMVAPSCGMKLIESPKAFGLLAGLAKGRGFNAIAHYNDATSTTHADIMALFDEAIALAETGDV